MKKIAISLVALAALSTASFASQRNYDLRDSDTYFGKYATQRKAPIASTFAFAVATDGQAMTNYERMMKVSEENDQGGH
jgi:hypothetical protein